MANINLKKYGIKGVKEILYNPTYEVLYNEETKPGLEQVLKAHKSLLSACFVMTIHLSSETGSALRTLP